MPTYEYDCKKCGASLEIFQSITERAKRKCPECGENGLARRIGTGAAILFKGSGFYETDYRSKSYTEGKSADSSSSSSDGESKKDAPKPEKPAKKDGGAKKDTKAKD